MKDLVKDNNAEKEMEILSSRLEGCFALGLVGSVPESSDCTKVEHFMIEQHVDSNFWLSHNDSEISPVRC